jgi:hypothetical protein
MAKECFCGCGRTIPKFPIGMRAINTRGRQVSERLDYVDGSYPHLKKQSEEIAAWVEQGHAIRASLMAAMHGETDAGAIPEGPIREWQTEGRHIEAFINQYVAAFAKWAQDMGYSDEEALLAAARGEYRAPGT